MDNLYQLEELEMHNEEEKRKAVFQDMLRQLERLGKCRDVYHRLANVLFNDYLQD